MAFRGHQDEGRLFSRSFSPRQTNSDAIVSCPTRTADHEWPLFWSLVSDRCSAGGACSGPRKYGWRVAWLTCGFSAFFVGAHGKIGMFASDHHRTQFSLRRGPALVGFLSVVLWVFQVVVGQPLYLSWSNETQSSESENRCETEELDCPAQLTNSLRSRSRHVAPIHPAPIPCRASHHASLVVARMWLCSSIGNPARCCPLRC